MLEFPLLTIAIFFAYCYITLNKRYKKLRQQKQIIIITDKYGNKRELHLHKHACMNQHCILQKKKGKGNIRFRKRYGKHNDRILLICSDCGKTFAETQGTMYFQKKKSIKKITNIIHYLTEGGEIRKGSRLFKVSQITILSYLKAASKKASLINKLHYNIKITGFQIDELWSFICKKDKNLKKGESKLGSIWGYVAFDFRSRFIVNILNGKRNMKNTIKFIENMKRNIDLRKKTLIMSDGYQFYIDAICKVFVKTKIINGITKKIISHNLFYGQIIKTKEKGRLVNIEYRFIIGTKKIFQNILEKFGLKNINTSLVERVNLSIRHYVGRFKRKGMGFSKKIEYHEASLQLFQAFYNFAKPHRGIFNKTPAMYLGLSNKVWTIEDILTYNEVI